MSENPMLPEVAPLTEEDVKEALRDVIDPELGVNVVDLGLLYNVEINGHDVSVDMTLTSAACPLTDMIEEQSHMAMDGLVSDFRINWVWLPPWGPDRITPEGREQLQALGFNV
ncbi:MAG: metal-sulfur cluster assembly factor [Actinomycetaceae bacterium]|nr:metal-sulfur cluster assembly factor [Arcanobacterium sp.]MDD7686486.1 metal-sulfur cluster assembly factor [Actinomycetaceae bacterium]MDY5272766.1 metal-sulfur cluster assembly factor [Arcanobacterium sp.]